MTKECRALAVNARFLTRPASGVDRVAIEIITILARRSDVGKLILLHPVSDTLHLGWLEALPQALRDRFILQPLGKQSGHIWEQLELACALPDHLLLSLCSTGPILRRNQAVMIHDAQVWDVPQSYSRAFRLAYRALLPMVARTARHVLTVSEFSARRLETLGIAPRGKPKIVRNGADHVLRFAPDPETFARHGLIRGGYFLAIGNLAPHKNLRLLIEAAAARRTGGPELIVAGGMNSKVFAEAGLKATTGVRFIGRVSDAELRALYEGAVALAFPSLTEGFGLPPVEAMLCGCPVIATTGGAVPEVCGDAVLYVDPNDQAGWTVALQRMATDAELCQRLVARGVARAQALTWERSVDTLVNVLQLGKPVVKPPSFWKKGRRE